jgi:hypothetical protein
MNMHISIKEEMKNEKMKKVRHRSRMGQLLPSRHLFLFPFFLLLFTTIGCQKDKLYEVQEETILPPNANKTKLKSDQQYIAILYANLFQSALSSDNLFEASECVQSIGDKDLVHEVLISNYMNTGGVILPTNEEMRADIDGFLTATYNRFLVRNPTEAERQFFKNYINTHPNVKPELVYFSFALSDEYQYY